MAKRPLSKIDGAATTPSATHKVIAISVPRRQDVLLSHVLAQLCERGYPSVSRSGLIQMLIAFGLEGRSPEQIVQSLGPRLWERQLATRRSRTRKRSLRAEQMELWWTP